MPPSDAGLVLVFASSEWGAKQFFRHSGLDPARCVVVLEPAQLSSVGVCDLPGGFSTGSAEFYDAEDFSEIVEVGVSRWWTWEQSADTFRKLREEVEMGWTHA